MWLAGRPETTRRAYTRDVAALLATHCLSRLTLGDLQEWAAGVVELAPASVRRRIAAAKSLTKFAHALGYSRMDVGRALRSPKVREGLQEKILPERVVQKMIAREKNVRDHALLLFLYATGARVSEACGLRWKDVIEREQGAQVALWGKGEKERVVLVPASVYDALREVGGWRRPEDAVFKSRKGGGPLSTVRVYQIVRRAAQGVGVREKVSPHWLRHAHASHSLDRGAPISLVQQTLGHASVATTGRYLHARPRDSSALYLPL